jgi:agmatinase
VGDVAHQVVEQLQDVEAIYVTCDIDGLDPACAPGTGVPEAGGPTTRDLLELLGHIFARLPVRAMDIVEVSPPIDPSGATVAAAVKLIYEAFGWIKKRDA